ncbi:c-type cytochrome biogenesis protein CcmI [Blastomonas fulva]|uniref:c-type cytochrome biogenesis protein CcmI n=1 Tax=Blastomonas fulva TaxID=1550728 RepID=UPI003F708C0F
MTLWIILTAMAAVVAALLTLPLVRRQEARADARAATLAVLRDQLADVDVQLAAGVIPPADAEGLRIEIKRRMLAAGHVPDDISRPLGSRALSGVAIGLAALVALAAAALYAGMGKPDLALMGGGVGGETAPAVAANPGADPEADPAAQAAADAEIGRLVTGIEARLAEKPDDAEGWRMLGWSYYNLRRFDESAKAYARAVALDPDGPGFQSAYGEALVQVAQGQVTPEAASAFQRAAAQDGSDARARYYLGIRKAQGGDLTGAIDDWMKLLGDSAADAPWVPQLRGIIEATAREAKVDVSARLAAIRPPASGGATVTAPPPGIPPGVLPGPSAEQAAAVQAMPPAAQQQMIRGMVEGLAERLKTNPRDEAGWMRLMRARSVLGEAAAARTARDNALSAFAGDAAAQGRIRAAAAEMGITG